MRAFLVVAVVSCAVSVPAFAQDAGAVEAAPAAPATDFVAQLDELWKTRDLDASMKATELAIRDGLKATPGSYDVLWRAARYRWWLADGIDDEKLKRQTAKEAWNLAERAQKASPNGPEGRYYTALSIGAYSQAVGILKALSEGLEGKFNEHLDYSIKHNEPFDRMGGPNAKGRYYWELPWPKRDLEKSRELYKKVLAKHPEHIRAWLFLAETELKDGKAKEAKAAMDQVNSRTIDFDPPEGRRIKKWAKAVNEQVDAALK